MTTIYEMMSSMFWHVTVTLELCCLIKIYNFLPISKHIPCLIFSDLGRKVVNTIPFSA